MSTSQCLVEVYKVLLSNAIIEQELFKEMVHIRRHTPMRELSIKVTNRHGNGGSGSRGSGIMERVHCTQCVKSIKPCLLLKSNPVVFVSNAVRVLPYGRYFRWSRIHTHRY
jgi:hypothetical protein